MYVVRKHFKYVGVLFEFPPVRFNGQLLLTTRQYVKPRMLFSSYSSLDVLLLVNYCIVRAFTYLNSAKNT